MLVKDYNTGKYKQLDKNEFVSQRHFYEEWMRIKYNYVIPSPDILEKMKHTLSHTVDQKKKDHSYR